MRFVEEEGLLKICCGSWLSCEVGTVEAVASGRRVVKNEKRILGEKKLGEMEEG